MENQIQETKMDQFVNLTTGELLGEGIFMSKEELERKQEAQIKRINYAYLMNNRSEFQTHISSNFGSFYFNNYMKLLTKLKNNPALLFRFLYLCTYANYDGYLKYGLHSSLYMLIRLAYSPQVIGNLFNCNRSITSLGSCSNALVISL